MTSDFRPWPRERMDLHVKQRILERVSICLRPAGLDEDGEPIWEMREGGEGSVWAVVQEAIREAGWKITQ